MRRHLFGPVDAAFADEHLSGARASGRARSSATRGADQIRSVRFAVADSGDELDPPPGGFRDAAAVVKCLDLVISCDSAVAHLAGALGVPVWLALSEVADWRWLRERSDTPWYPRTVLYRQERLGDWSAVFARMADDVRRLETRVG